jgi:hypothetical protein
MSKIYQSNYYLVSRILLFFLCIVPYSPQRARPDSNRRL